MVLKTRKGKEARDNLVSLHDKKRGGSPGHRTVTRKISLLEGPREERKCLCGGVKEGAGNWRYLPMEVRGGVTKDLKKFHPSPQNGRWSFQREKGRGCYKGDAQQNSLKTKRLDKRF